MPAAVPKPKLTSCFNLHYQEGWYKLYFWDIVIGEYGNPLTFKALVDALLHAKEYDSPVHALTLTPHDFRRFVTLCEKHKVTMVTEGAIEILHREKYGSTY